MKFFGVRRIQIAMTIDRDLPLLTAADLEQALLADVMYVHKHGLASVPDPEEIPVLAELALGHEGDINDCGEGIEELLHDAISRLSKFDRFSRQVLRKGISALLGIGEQKWETQADRFNNAAIELKYRNGESFRKTTREKERAKRYIWEECLEQLAKQLVILASDDRFIYAGRFALSATPQSVAERKPPGVDPDALAVIIGAELRTVLARGIENTIKHKLVPTLSELSEAPSISGTTKPERTEALLRWAIDQAQNPFSQDRTAINLLTSVLFPRRGIFILAGLGAYRGMSFVQRTEHAASELGYPSAAALRKSMEAMLLRIVPELSKPLGELATRERV